MEERRAETTAKERAEAFCRRFGGVVQSIPTLPTRVSIRDSHGAIGGIQGKHTERKLVVEQKQNSEEEERTRS
jgi:hypothetical protein